MRLYNTLTRQVEPLTPPEDGIWRMYVCGVTPYDTAHLGHAFTYVNFDVMERYLEYCGDTTLTVENVTDIDDDILRKAKEIGMAWNELAERETKRFLNDMDALNVRRTDHFPYATDEIDMILEMVKKLLDQGRAYEKDGSVYYPVKDDPDFPKLVDMDYEAMLKTANERGNFPDDPNKRDPLDFVLWQAAKPGEPTWSSPWGEGRPGWHIECSAMSMRYLGSRLDIHCGGEDLIFPHHTCEIAQSENYSGEEPFVRYWFHVAMVRLDGEKMSKSLGNMLFVRDLLTDYSADAIRIFLLSHHYRREWAADNYHEELRDAEAMMGRWRQTLGLPPTENEAVNLNQYRAEFEAAMNDDFNTPQAIRVLDQMAHELDEAARRGQDIQAGQTLLRELGDVLGLVLDQPQQQ